jgi:zinc transport system substrate-binding protein
MESRSKPLASARIAALAVGIGMVLFFFAVPSHGQTVVTSTSLTAAVARAAGAKEIRTLTPADVKHPPEYELKPSDVAKLDGIQVVVYAGYERMVQKLLDVSGSKGIQAIKVDTALSPENLIQQARKIAAALHTEKAESAWEELFAAKLAALKAKLAPFAAKRAIVVFHAQPFARWAGLDVIQVLNPGEISVKALTEAVAQRPDIVVDIAHMPAARVIADNAHSRYAQIINFPGVGGTATLEDIFEFNTTQLVKAFQ